MGWTVAAIWIATGIVISAWSYRKNRPPQWVLGAVAITALWPLAFVGAAIERWD